MSNRHVCMGNRAGKTRLTYEVANLAENPPHFTAAYTSENCACGANPTRMIPIDIDFKNRVMTYKPECEECFVFNHWFKQPKKG